MSHSSTYGIANIGIYDPSEHELQLPNEWFAERGVIGKKFVHHTGIVRRGVSFIPEREMALHAIEDLQQRTKLNVADCAGLVFTSSNLIPEGNEWRQSIQKTKLLGIGDLFNLLSNLQTLAQKVGLDITAQLETIAERDWTGTDLSNWDGIRDLGREIGFTKEQMDRMEAHRLKELGSVTGTAQEIGAAIGLPPEHVRGVGWGCSGYVRSWEVLGRELLEKVEDLRNQFLLVITSSRPSRFLDFGCPMTGGLLGDYATATAVTHAGHASTPPRLALKHCSTANPEACTVTDNIPPSKSVLFDYEDRRDVLCPTPDGGESHDAQRPCFTMDGESVVYSAEAAWVTAAERAVAAGDLSRENVKWWLGHQPGRKVWERGIIGLRERGFSGEMPTDLTAETGNITCSSIPNALRMFWDRLNGIVACPAIGMYAAGSRHMSQGCLVFEAQ